MERSPLVTVITPCFGDVATLPMALASLVAQSMEDWECIIVNDGSGTPVADVVDSFDDPRMVYRAFSKNQGRPVARQAGLEMARGRYICMLDADDWYFPRKLQRQIEVLEDHPELVAVSTGMAVINGKGELTGVRALGKSPLEIRHCQPPRPPKLAFSPIMIRRDAALEHRFDPRLKRAEDPDYLMKVLGGRPYGMMNSLAYAYCEEYSPRSMDEALKAFRYQRIIFGCHFDEDPMAAGWQYALSLLKTTVYGAARATRRGRWLFERRNQDADVGQWKEFELSRRKVQEILWGMPDQWSQRPARNRP